MSNRPLVSLSGAVVAAALTLAGCTGSPDRDRPDAAATARASHRPLAAPAMRLVAFDSCERLGAELRAAARNSVGPYGFGGPESLTAGVARAAAGAGTAGPATRTDAFSATNNHEQSADEPDIVKTDGRRIVTVARGVLRVVDPASRRQTGRLVLGAEYAEADLLLHGDRALVLLQAGHGGPHDPAAGSPGEPTPALLLVDLTGTPTVTARYRAPGMIVDARQSGGVARVVLRTAPRITFPDLPQRANEQQRLQANRKAIDAAPTEAWLPEYELTTGNRSREGRLGCNRLHRPAAFSGTSVLTVLTFDLSAPTLDTGDPVAVVADGDTVYGTGSALYVTHDDRWHSRRWRGAGTAPARRGGAAGTEIFRFSTVGAGRPTYTGAGSVPGWLINQYAMSEWNGHLRVATTTDDLSADPRPSTEATPQIRAASAVRVLATEGETLTQVGVVDGLGKGEQIYSVRFIGPRGYVVTFRQTDPLYSLDLSDPGRPTVTGELKITGYSAHLQPAGDGRLLGIGQEATTQGRTTGTQVALFDVADPAHPRRLDQHVVTDSYSMAEHDPHALLWWPATGLLVAPVQTHGNAASDGGQPAEHPTATAMALRVSGDGLTVAGSIAHPRNDVGLYDIRRSLVVGDVLWTVSDGGLQANDLTTLARLGWVPAG